MVLLKTLSIEKALELYKLLAPYLPDEEQSADLLGFVGEIIKNIQNSENQEEYFTAITLMTGMTIKDFLKIGSIETLKIFAEGLMVNDIVSLRKFCGEVGLNGR